jgi:hypothetical protein
MFLKNIKKGHLKAMIKLEIAACACCDFAADSVRFARRVSKDSRVMAGAAAATGAGVERKEVLAQPQRRRGCLEDLVVMDANHDQELTF